MFSPAAQAAVTTANVNCRAAAATSARIVERVSAGTSVSILDRAGTWTQVDRARDCWVAARYLAEDGSYVPARSFTPSTYSKRSRQAAETRRANRRSLSALSRQASRSKRSQRSAPSYYGGGGSCPCSGANVCVGPRGGRYCITSGGNKRYGV
ncbi:SH3 domain-containing protein [Sphingomonas sp. CCH5-D11]|uniref:SH3 domain-containing protein n=1 Tax=Sphingomonas sp. CCH5-D11 TaxID=1768786 RepID=UPI003FA75236